MGYGSEWEVVLLTTSNLDIAKKDRCEMCKGRGEFPGGVCSIPWHPPEKTTPCKNCDGTGLNKEALKALRKEERAEARKQAKEEEKI